MNNTPYELTNSWFEKSARTIWDSLIPQVNPSRILEIGSYEGASTCYLIDKLSGSKSIEIHCADSWEGGIEHKVGGSSQVNMSEVERRFKNNTNIAIRNAKNKVTLISHKNYSDLTLSKLISQGKLNYFDMIYIDGSHQAPDVLTDAVLSFKLLKKNGVMIFDDYLWQEPLSYGADPLRCPKIAVDAFTNIYFRKLKIIKAPLYQIYAQKICD